jgi:hypothetical protein
LRKRSFDKLEGSRGPGFEWSNKYPFMIFLWFEEGRLYREVIPLTPAYRQAGIGVRGLKR